MRIKVVFLLWMMGVQVSIAQSGTVTHRLCEFEIQLPGFVRLENSGKGNKANPSFCEYSASINGYGRLSISSNLVTDDFFKGDPLGMFESLREYSNVMFDDDRCIIKDHQFTIYGESESGEAVYMRFVYSKTIQASVRYDFPMEKSTSIQSYIDAFEKTFKAN